MRTAARRMSECTVTLALVGAAWACDRPAVPPTPSAGASAPTPAPTAPAPADPPHEAPPVATAIEPASAPDATPAAPGITIAPFPDAQPSGLPAFTVGRAIRLRSLEVGSRTAGDRTMPTVALADAASRARLDEEIEREARITGNRCRVELALETFVSLRCPWFDASLEDMGGAGMGRGMNVALFRVGRGGDVARLESPLELFHPGIELADLERRWLHDPDGHPAAVVVTDTGIELSEPTEEGPPVRLSWRAVAPYVRADGPLGPALAAEGLPLAPPGTTMPIEPTIVPGVHAADAASLVARWLALPADLRAQARLATPGGTEEHAALLVFAPTVDRGRLGALGLRTSSAYFTEPMAEIVLARATDRVEIRERAGPNAELVASLPPGTIVPAVRGEVDRTGSELGRGHWTFVAGGELEHGWAQGRALEPLGASCLPEPDGGVAIYRGTFEMREQGASTPFAWFLYHEAGHGAFSVQLAIHPLDGCTVGPLRHLYGYSGGLEELHFAPTEETTGDTLIVARTTRGIAVTPQTGEAYEHELGEHEAIEVPATRGPGGERGYWPVAFGARGARTWLRWNGTAIEEVPASR